LLSYTALAGGYYLKNSIMDLFTKSKVPQEKLKPLSARMRPKDLSEFIGQSHIIEKDKLLRRAIEADRIGSLIFYGPPGTGKTALGHIICGMTNSYFERINATSSNVQDIRKVLDKAKKIFDLKNKKTVFFIDEIHRFNKAQQDVLLPDIEDGNPVLIGTTTHNPFFSVNPALLSRSQIFEFKSLSSEDIVKILKRAASDKENGFGEYKIKFEDNALAHLAKVSDGDARRALSALEVGILTTAKDKKGVINFTKRSAEESIQKKIVMYDNDEDEHYDTASAFIKSMRGSDPDATLYWLAKMIVAGEDPRFIARRIVILASEDVGNADPQAIVVANSAMQAADFVGFPEARIILAQAAVYVACAPKSNAAYMGIDNAINDIKNEKTQKVPIHLKDASYKGAKQLGHQKDYKYAHDYKNHYVKQRYMPVDKKYYTPTNIGYEAKIKEWLEKLAHGI